MGLKTDIMYAKKRALSAQGIEVRDEDFKYDSPNEIEARFMTDAIVNFLTHDDLHRWFQLNDTMPRGNLGEMLYSSEKQRLRARDYA